MLDGSVGGGQDPVGLLLARGELAGEGGLVADDDHWIVTAVGEVEEAEVGQGAEAGRA